VGIAPASVMSVVVAPIMAAIIIPVKIVTPTATAKAVHGVITVTNLRRSVVVAPLTAAVIIPVKIVTPTVTAKTVYSVLTVMNLGQIVAVAVTMGVMNTLAGTVTLNAIVQVVPRLMELLLYV